MPSLPRRLGFLMALTGVITANMPSLLYIVGDIKVRAFLTTTSLPFIGALAGAGPALLGTMLFLREVRREPPPPLFSWRPRKESFL